MPAGGRIDVLEALRRGLQAATWRHRVLADNMANADTPGFKRSDVRFSDVFREAVEARQRIPMTRTHALHSAGGTRMGDMRPVIMRDGSVSQRMDGNNVDIERELAEITKNTLFYDALSQQIQKKLSLLRTVVNEGRR